MCLGNIAEDLHLRILVALPHDAPKAPAAPQGRHLHGHDPGNNGMVEVTVELTENAIKSIKIGKNMETEYIAKRRWKPWPPR